MEQPTFPERRKLVEDISKDLTTIASQLSHMAVVLAREADHMAAAERRFANRPQPRWNQTKRAKTTSPDARHDSPRAK